MQQEKIKKEWGYEENINGSKFIVYCDVQEECDNLDILLLEGEMDIHVK